MDNLPAPLHAIKLEINNENNPPKNSAKILKGVAYLSPVSGTTDNIAPHNDPKTTPASIESGPCGKKTISSW